MDQLYKSILSDKTLQFSSSEAGIRCITKKRLLEHEISFIHRKLLRELEKVGFTISYRFTIYRQDGTANMNFTVRKKENQLEEMFRCYDCLEKSFKSELADGKCPHCEGEVYSRDAVWFSLGKLIKQEGST